MRVINHSLETAPLDAVKPHPRNPRQGNIGAIHQSIDANGFYGVIIAQKSTGHILAGNHRWQAARTAGATEIPVQWVDVDDDHALRILLADNRTNDLASYDDTALAELLTELAEIGDLEGTGYDGDDLDTLLADLGMVGTIDFPSLPDGDKEPFQQMTFVLHDSQAELVRAAIDAALAEGHGESESNTNRNGNALAAIAAAYRPAS